MDGSNVLANSEASSKILYATIYDTWREIMTWIRMVCTLPILCGRRPEVFILRPFVSFGILAGEFYILTPSIGRYYQRSSL